MEEWERDNIVKRLNSDFFLTVEQDPFQYLLHNPEQVNKLFLLTFNFRSQILMREKTN